MDPKNPSIIFYFNDWRNDPSLKVCSLAARGLWLDLLDIAARSPEPGVVQIGSLNCSLPDGLPHIAAVVGRPLQEIAPLIDELIASGAASRDRRGRLYNRRMKRDAALSVKRSESGRKGADVTNGKKRRIEGLPRQNPGKPPGKPPASSYPPSSLPLHESGTGGVAARDSIWAERLDGYRPWEGVNAWSPHWGPRPDSAGTNPLIPGELLAKWRAKYGIEMARARAGVGRVETDG